MAFIGDIHNPRYKPNEATLALLGLGRQERINAIIEDIERLGISGRVKHSTHTEEFYLWVHSQEDYNLYKLAGKYNEAWFFSIMLDDWWIQ